MYIHRSLFLPLFLFPSHRACSELCGIRSTVILSTCTDVRVQTIREWNERMSVGPVDGTTEVFLLYHLSSAATLQTENTALQQIIS